MTHRNRTTSSARPAPNVAYRPIAWVVSSLFVLAPLVFADAARAQSAVGLRSHVPFTEWAGQTLAAPAQVKVDEQKRAAEIDTAEGQARLAAEAKRAEEARQRQRAEEQAKLVREAQAREVQRMAEEAARLEAARAEALAKQRADEERAAAEKRRQQEQARAEAIAQQQAEAERAAREKQRQAEAARAAEAAKQQADAERTAAERRHQEELARAVEAARAAAEARAQQAEDQRREMEARAAAAREAQAHAEAERKAEAESARAEAEKTAAAVEAQAKARAARQNQSEHLPAQRSDDSLVEFKAVGPTGTVPAMQQEARTVALQDKPQPSLASVARPPETQRQSANAPLAAVEGPKARHGKASALPTKGAPGQFAQWLEAQSDDYGTGPTPSPEKLREIFWQAVQMAAERSPEVRQAYASYQAANADVAEAKGQRWPQVDIGAQSPGVNFGPGDSGEGGNAGNPLSVSVTTNLFDWG